MKPGVARMVIAVLVVVAILWFSISMNRRQCRALMSYARTSTDSAVIMVGRQSCYLYLGDR